MVLFGRGFIQFCCVFTLITMSLCLFPSQSAAQFVKTGGAYQDARLYAKVIPVTSGAMKGIFGIYFSHPVSLQKFSLDIKDPGARSFFLEYNPATNQYSALHVVGTQNGKEYYAVYGVRGSFALEILGKDGSSMTLKVDNDPNP